MRVVECSLLTAILGHNNNSIDVDITLLTIPYHLEAFKDQPLGFGT